MRCAFNPIGSCAVSDCAILRFDNVPENRVLSGGCQIGKCPQTKAVSRLFLRFAAPTNNNTYKFRIPQNLEKSNKKLIKNRTELIKKTDGFPSVFCFYFVGKRSGV
ncbi:MAG TPA: hypothetical protein DCE08_08070 [Ruminococcaceae bacterium]|nr:hypothetical protein [Oscillospiraceae bacterium]